MPGLPKRHDSGWEGWSMEKQKTQRGIRGKEEGAHLGSPHPHVWLMAVDSDRMGKQAMGSDFGDYAG